jgi:hypothetical protein
MSTTRTLWLSVGAMLVFGFSVFLWTGGEIQTGPSNA